MAKTNPDTIRVIAYREPDSWVAQCLEYDISSQGADFQTAMARLQATVNCEADYTRRKHGEAFKSIGPAPRIFFDMFEAADGEAMRASENMELKIAA
jgi:hypothetical protein